MADENSGQAKNKVGAAGERRLIQRMGGTSNFCNRGGGQYYPPPLLQNREEVL